MNDTEVVGMGVFLVGVVLLAIIICTTFYHVNVPQLKIECSGAAACHEIMEKLNK